MWEEVIIIKYENLILINKRILFKLLLTIVAQGFPGNGDISVEEVILSGNVDSQIIAGNRAPSERANTTFPLSVYSHVM